MLLGKQREPGRIYKDESHPGQHKAAKPFKVDRLTSTEGGVIRWSI